VAGALFVTPRQGARRRTEPQQWYDALLAIDREALTGGHYEIAYHVLAAALHCAEAARDVEYAESVAALAEEHRRRVDAEQPPHRLGGAAAATRGHHGLFELLAGQAAAVIARLHGAKAVERAARPPWPDREPGRGEGGE
jgi:hypothetical protein